MIQLASNSIVQIFIQLKDKVTLLPFTPERSIMVDQIDYICDRVAKGIPLNVAISEVAKIKRE
jgi:hypothetical protein